MNTLTDILGITETNNWNVLSARAGTGRSVRLSTLYREGAVITFRSRIAPEHVQDGLLKAVPVTRDGNSRMLSIAVTDGQVDALYQLLRRYRKKRTFFNQLERMVTYMLSYVLEKRSAT